MVEDDGRFAGLAHRAAVEHAALREDGTASSATSPRRAPRRARCPPTRRSRACSPPSRCAVWARSMAVDDEGRLRGVVTFEQVSRALRARLAPT